MEIKELILKSANIEKQTQFYKDILGLDLINQSDKKLSFRIGASILTLEASVNFTPYHFAFNIASNKENEALSWLKERVAVLPLGNKEIADFTSWNAKSIYFYDEDKNIAEFIARKNLKVDSTAPFNSNQILNISEIGVPVNDIETTYRKINSLNNIEVYDGNFDKFCAVGDEYGLFIVINKNKKGWYPTDEKAYSSEFVIKGDYNFRFKNGKIETI